MLRAAAGSAAAPGHLVGVGAPDGVGPVRRGPAGFTDAAAQRRVQTMRLSRRHGWVRGKLQSGKLNLTSAAQLETAFAGAERAERAERQSRTGRRNVGQGRCQDQDQDQDQDSAGPTSQLGPPAAPSEAGERGERGPRSASELAPPAHQCCGDAAAVNAPVVPVASHAVGQDSGAGHAGALLPPPGLNGSASPFPAPPCVSVPAALSSDEGPAPQLPPPPNLPAPAPVPAPVVAPSESLRAASRAPESSRDDPFAELSPGRSSAAPLLHPQRQRELIEQAAGMSTRQVAGLLAAAAPEVVPARDTLRVVAPDRYTLKVSIDQECEQGLRLLKDLVSHVDPRMSWGDLVARLVREAVVRHEPHGGGNGQRRHRAGSAGASPRRSPNKTRPAGAAAGPAERANESSGRAPNRTRAAVAPTAPAQRGGGDTPALPGDTAAAGGQTQSTTLANAAAARQSVPAALSNGARAGGAPSAAPAATAAPKLAGGASADGLHAGAVVLVSPAATPAPKPAHGVSPDGGLSGAPAGTVVHPTRDSVHSPHQSPPRRHIPAAVRRDVWHRDGGRCCYRDPLTGRRCTSSHLLQIDHLLPVAQGGGPEPSNLELACFAHHRMRHGHGPAPPPESPT